MRSIDDFTGIRPVPVRVRGHDHKWQREFQTNRARHKLSTGKPKRQGGPDGHVYCAGDWNGTAQLSMAEKWGHHLWRYRF
jgi:hypothetical protein